MGSGAEARHFHRDGTIERVARKIQVHCGSPDPTLSCRYTGSDTLDRPYLSTLAPPGVFYYRPIRGHRCGTVLDLWRYGR